MQVRSTSFINNVIHSLSGHVLDYYCISVSKGEWISGATCMYLANKLVEVIKAVSSVFISVSIVTTDHCRVILINQYQKK